MHRNLVPIFSAYTDTGSKMESILQGVASVAAEDITDVECIPVLRCIAPARSQDFQSIYV